MTKIQSYVIIKAQKGKEMNEMKMFKATIEAITMDSSADNVIKTSTETIIPAQDRAGAIYSALDVGQAMARSVNSCPGIALYFRVTDVKETDEGIA